MKINEYLKSAGVDLSTAKPRQTGVWRGPLKDGITFSLLSRFLVCRKRFYHLVFDGLKPADRFNHRLEYGNFWHACEEGWAAGGAAQWREYLRKQVQKTLEKYKEDRNQVEHWWHVCETQFPLYVSYWSSRSSRQKATPLVQEGVFFVPFILPSGRGVSLRGKWDSIDLLKTGRSSSIWIQENKTKGDIKEGQLQRQLTYDLQTMLYVIALQESMRNQPEAWGTHRKARIAGVRYNVVRRPLSGGKGTIVRHKPSKSNPAGESESEYYQRLGKVIEEDPGNFFMRWEVEIDQADIDRFKEDCLIPILENLCSWWEEICGKKPKPAPFHWRHPYGVWNVLDEGGSSELDQYLIDGSTVGLERVTNLFPELVDAD